MVQLVNTGMAGKVDADGLNPSEVTHAGSTPAARTIFCYKGY